MLLKWTLEILAVCVASTVDAVDCKRGSFDGDGHADQLAAPLKLDFIPTSARASAFPQASNEGRDGQGGGQEA
jgi:hypothetical protein